MIDYSNLRHPPEDPTSGPGSASAICSFGTAPPLLGFHAHRAGTVDGLDPGIPDDAGQDPNSLYRYFNVAGNTYRCGTDWGICLHLGAAPDSVATAPLPVRPGSIFRIGLFPFFIDNSGGLYSVVDRTDPLEPKRVFGNDDEAWMDLICPASRAHPPGLSDMLGPCAPATSHEHGILNFGFGQAPVYVPDAPPPDTPPFPSPASSNSSASESSSGSDMPHSPPSLFVDAWPEGVAPIPAAPNPPSPPMTPPLDEGELDRVAEINAYVDSLATQRKRRGSGPSPIKLECPRCKKTSRRPSELKYSDVHVLGARMCTTARRISSDIKTSAKPVVLRMMDRRRNLKCRDLYFSMMFMCLRKACLS
ncbi:hypothetical protein FRC10_006253 [Ceratobasidium sp. 414]|nr:hypothetical protein FRC10_006253 [Ceratobasidium sp. 414]